MVTGQRSRERKVTSFRAIEYLVFMDCSLLESEMFAGWPNRHLGNYA